MPDSDQVLVLPEKPIRQHETHLKKNVPDASCFSDFHSHEHPFFHSYGKVSRTKCVNSPTKRIFPFPFHFIC